MKQQRFVVGVDGSASGRAALRWASAHAAEHDGDTVHAITAWRPDASPTTSSARPAKAQKTKLEAMLAAEIAALPEDERSRVEITTEVAQGAPGEVLVDACIDADMLVLGTHGHGKTWHMMFGWTSEECVRKVSCPVVIIPSSKAP
jgi:nucleotide-binding universal stress UspA family protein